MGMVAILVKWPKTNIIFILFYLLNTPLKFKFKQPNDFWEKKCLDTYVAVQNEWPWILSAYIKPVFY